MTLPGDGSSGFGCEGKGGKREKEMGRKVSGFVTFVSSENVQDQILQIRHRQTEITIKEMGTP